MDLDETPIGLLVKRLKTQNREKSLMEIIAGYKDAVSYVQAASNALGEPEQHPYFAGVGQRLINSKRRPVF